MLAILSSVRNPKDTRSFVRFRTHVVSLFYVKKCSSREVVFWFCCFFNSLPPSCQPQVVLLLPRLHRGILLPPRPRAIRSVACLISRISSFYDAWVTPCSLAPSSNHTVISISSSRLGFFLAFLAFCRVTLLLLLPPPNPSHPPVP